MTTRRRYSDDDRANALAALAANKGDVPKTARELGIPGRTLRAWVRGDRHPEAAQACQEKKGPLADRLTAIAWAIAEVLDSPDKLRKASINQAATAFGIVVDKMRILRGEPTAISQTAPSLDLSRLTDDELRVLAKLLRSAARPDPGGGGAGPPPAG